jgi:hypothetical protein
MKIISAQFIFLLDEHENDEVVNIFLSGICFDRAPMNTAIYKDTEDSNVRYATLEMIDDENG